MREGEQLAGWAQYNRRRNRSHCVLESIKVGASATSQNDTRETTKVAKSIPGDFLHSDSM
jgi:hypothetical protein